MRAASPGLRWVAATVGVLAVGALNVLWQLGSSALYVDEVLSWRPAVVSLHELYQRVSAVEIAPPGYYAGLHEWIFRLGSQQEWVLRLPSALAAIALVGVVIWLARLLADQRTALAAGLLAALSPVVLEFGQEARAYVFVMLFCAVAVASLLEARGRPDGRGRVGWLVLAGVATVAGLWTHYTANLVLVVLLGWFAWRPGAGKQGRVVLPAVGVVADLLLGSLLSHQLGQGHEAGIATSASFTIDHLLGVLGTPFAGRPEAVTGWVALGAVVVVVAVGWVVAMRRRDLGLVLEVILPAAVIPIAAVVVITLVSSAVLLTRYSAVAAPFLMVLIAVVIVRAARPLAIGLGVAALAAAMGESALTHRPGGFYADMRGGMARIAQGYRPGDFVFLTGYPALPYTVEYYQRRGLQAAPFIYPAKASQILPAVIRERRRIWLFASGPRPTAASVTRALGPLGYRPAEVDHFPGITPLSLVLAVPV